MKLFFKNKGFLLFFISIIIFLSIFVTTIIINKLNLTPINFLLVWLYIIPLVLLFLSILYFVEFILTKTFNQKNFKYVKTLVEWLFNQITDFSKQEFKKIKSKKIKKTKEKDIFWIAPIVVLVIAIFPLPIGYYTLSRLVVSACALYYAIQFHKRNNTTYTWIYGFLVVLYNPIIPIYLYEKFIWVVVNIITIYIFYKNKKNNE